MPVLLSIDEVDIYLRNAYKIPSDERNEMWRSIVDELLERRHALSQVEANLVILKAERG